MEYSSDSRTVPELVLSSLRAFFLDLDDAKYRMAAVLEELKMPPKEDAAQGNGAKASKDKSQTSSQSSLSESTTDTKDDSSLSSSAASSAPPASRTPIEFAKPVSVDEAIPLAKHVVNLDEFDALNARSLSSWQRALFQQYVRVRLSPSVLLSDAQRWWGAPRLSTALLLFLVSPLIHARKIDALRAASMNRHSDKDIGTKLDPTVFPTVPDDSSSSSSSWSSLSELSRLRSALTVARQAASDRKQCTGFVLNVSDPAADAYMAELDARGSQGPQGGAPREQAPMRPPSFSTTLVLLAAPEGVYCFRAPLPPRLAEFDEQQQQATPDEKSDEKSATSSSSSSSSSSSATRVGSLLESWDSGVAGMLDALQVLCSGVETPAAVSQKDDQPVTSSTAATAWNDLLNTAFAVCPVKPHAFIHSHHLTLF
jgi:hypothetical protein